ncbi:hypothetical protein [Escherichia coli]|nr:hypothetical protein [Escherichia coli]
MFSKLAQSTIKAMF